ncbi:hypothetical protein [Cloacibacillus porcorum]
MTKELEKFCNEIFPRELETWKDIISRCAEKADGYNDVLLTPDDSPYAILIQLIPVDSVTDIVKERKDVK